MNSTKNVFHRLYLVHWIHIMLAGPIWYRRIQEIFQEGVWEQNLQNLQTDRLTICQEKKSKSALHHLYFITRVVVVVFSYHWTVPVINRSWGNKNSDSNFESCFRGNFTTGSVCCCILEKLRGPGGFFYQLSTNTWKLLAQAFVKCCPGNPWCLYMYAASGIM